MKDTLLKEYKRLMLESNIKLDLMSISHTSQLMQSNIDFSFDNIDSQLKEIERKIKLIRKDAKRITLLEVKRKLT